MAFCRGPTGDARESDQPALREKRLHGEFAEQRAGPLGGHRAGDMALLVEGAKATTPSLRDQRSAGFWFAAGKTGEEPIPIPHIDRRSENWGIGRLVHDRSGPREPEAGCQTRPIWEAAEEISGLPQPAIAWKYAETCCQSSTRTKPVAVRLCGAVKRMPCPSKRSRFRGRSSIR